jgi:hypothetical protein
MPKIPLISDPPFHRPVTPEEVEAILAYRDGRAGLPNGFEIGVGWTLSFFRIAGTLRPSAEFGWVKGDFAIYEKPFRARGKIFPCASLTYLPNGLSAGHFSYVEDAIAATPIIHNGLDRSDASHKAMRAQAAQWKALLKRQFDSRIVSGLTIWSLRDTGDNKLLCEGT